MISAAHCRFCRHVLQTVVVDLGMSPLCESFVTHQGLTAMEPFYPLRVYLCENCFLMQLDEFVSPREIFSDYAYFSSYSDAWVRHAEEYVSQVTERFRLGPSRHVVEIASNDGYLLQFFVHRGIPALGIEPAANVAEVAQRKGIETRVAFFGTELAQQLKQEGRQADLVVANNVLAHVHDLNGFVAGMKILLKADGVITLEFPHLMRLIDENQFDTIYHEHFSYFSLLTAERVLAAHELVVFDVQELWTHGGSLRVFATHAPSAAHATSDRVAALREKERRAGIETLSYYEGFSHRVEATKRQLLRFLIDAKEAGKTIAAYGAPGKGNTLLNYCGIRADFIDYTVDRNPRKQGKYLPGTHIPIRAPAEIERTKPDYVLILPWNLKDEIMNQISFIRQWGGRFVIPIPQVRVLR